MTQVNINNFVPRQAEDFLLFDGEGYEVTFKKLDNKQVTKFHAGHNQFMEIVAKYGLKPKWQKWENAPEGSAKRGQYVEVK